MIGIGVAAGLGTAFAWAVSSTIHTSISRSLGVHGCMMLRQPLAVAALFLPCLLAGQFQTYSFYALFLAAFSGVMGVVVCDWCLYEGVLRIGIRPAMVCQSLYTCFTAVLGSFLLDEHLGLQGMLGIGIATAGVILVILAEQSRSAAVQPLERGQWGLGIFLALCAGVAMAIGFIGSKAALQEGIPPLMLAFLRNLVGSMALWGVGVGLHRIRSTLDKARNHPGLIRLLLTGCVVGPAGGIWLSTVALEYSPAAVASMLIGLQPIALLVVSGVWERRCPSMGSILGSCVACGGAALMLLR